MNALLVDIGNTRVKWRVARLDEATDDPRWLSAEEATRLTDVGDVEAVFRASASAEAMREGIDVALVANVADDAAGRTVIDAVSAVWPGSEARLARSATALDGLVNGYRNPLQLGVDRWLAAVAAHALCPDRPVLVCTFGTATTIDLVEAHRFVGGLILPGLETMRNALSTSTARLTSDTGRVVAIGDRTEDAIASGVMAAQIGAVEHTLRKVCARQGTTEPPLCIVAGGAAGSMAAAFDDLDVPYRSVHDLVLRGLAIAARDLFIVAAEPLAPIA